MNSKPYLWRFRGFPYPQTNTPTEVCTLCIPGLWSLFMTFMESFQHRAMTRNAGQDARGGGHRSAQAAGAVNSTSFVHSLWLAGGKTSSPILCLKTPYFRFWKFCTICRSFDELAHQNESRPGASRVRPTVHVYLSWQPQTYQTQGFEQVAIMAMSFQFSLKGADSLGASAKGAGGGRGGSAGWEPRTPGTEPR